MADQENTPDYPALVAELQNEIAVLSAYKQEADAASLLREKGLPAKAAKLYVSSGAENVEAFLAEYGDLFPATPVTNDNVDPAVQAGFNTIENTTSGAVPGGDDSPLARIHEAAKGGPDAIAAVMRELGKIA